MVLVEYVPLVVVVVVVAAVVIRISISAETENFRFSLLYSFIFLDSAWAAGRLI